MPPPVPIGPIMALITPSLRPAPTTYHPLMKGVEMQDQPPAVEMYALLNDRRATALTIRAHARAPFRRDLYATAKSRLHCRHSRALGLEGWTYRVSGLR